MMLGRVCLLKNPGWRVQLTFNNHPPKQVLESLWLCLPRAHASVSTLSTVTRLQSTPPPEQPAPRVRVDGGGL